MIVPQSCNATVTRYFARQHEVHSHIGIAGCYVDLAVADPTRPGRYLLGIECDGASYRQARSARDRDRLRKSVLEDHGWIMHRVWCNDWFQRPQEELSKAIAAIESAKAELESRAYGAVQKRAVPVKVVTVERTNVTEIGLVPEDEEDGLSLRTSRLATSSQYEACNSMMFRSRRWWTT